MMNPDTLRSLRGVILDWIESQALRKPETNSCGDPRIWGRSSLTDPVLYIAKDALRT